MSKSTGDYVEDLIMTCARPDVGRKYREALSETIPGFKKFHYDSATTQREMRAFDASFMPGKGQLDALADRFPEDLYFD